MKCCEDVLKQKCQFGELDVLKVGLNLCRIVLWVSMSLIYNLFSTDSQFLGIFLCFWL